MELPDAEVDHGDDGRQHQGVERNPLRAEEKVEP